MSLRVSEVVMDCADHGAVVDFWAAALGYERQAVNEQYVALNPTAVAESKVIAEPVHGGPNQ